jgi:hypothetical protein
MRHRYDKYRFHRSTMEEAVKATERVLGEPFHQRDSSYRGIYYRTDLKRREYSYMIFEKDGDVFLDINQADDMDGIRDRLLAQIPDVELVCSEVVVPPDDDDDD